MSLSRSTAPPVRKHFHPRRAWSGGRIAASAQPGRSARRTPVRCSIWRNSQAPTPSALPSKQAYLQAARGRLEPRRCGQGYRQGAARSGQARPACGDLVPGYALSAGRAERHWHDESAAIAALIALGLVRDDVIAETMRSPKQVELRAKARGLKVPKNSSFRIAPASRWCGSKTHAPRCPDGARSCDRFPRHSTAFKEGATMTKQNRSRP